MSEVEIERRGQRGIAVHADWDFANGDSLHSVTGYRSWQFRQDGMDADFTGANVLTINESFRTDFFSQEFTYNGTAGDAEYVVGLYYADEDIDGD